MSVNTPCNPSFTIFIPTYNRASLLPRAFSSIEAQDCRDFEVLIIDDGSTDETRQIVEEWRGRVDFPVHYHFQPNQGKPAAHNTAIALANGFFTVILDSDDTLANNALSILMHYWETIPVSERTHFTGVEGHCALLSSGEISGDLFPEDILDSDYLEMRHRYQIGGDKKSAMRTDILRAFPFPRFAGEKHIRESVVWNRIAANYKTRYINQVIQYIEYQPEGISANIFTRRVSNPHGFRLAHMEMINDFSRYCSPNERYKEMSKYVRYSFHCKISIAQQRKAINKKVLYWAALPKGMIDYLRDRHKMTTVRSDHGLSHD